MKSDGMENAATNSRPGTASNMENSSTGSPPSAAEVMTPATASGGAGAVTDAATIPACSGLKSAEDHKLTVIRHNRNRGMLPTLPECDFLLELAERLTKGLKIE